MDGDAGAPVAGRRIAVLLEYDGTAYSGSQYQENGPSIQSELETAIRKLTSEEARASAAGPAAPACGLYLVSVAYEGFGFEPEVGNGQSG